MILSVTLRSLYALVSYLCLTGLPEVAMPSSDMWQERQITLQHIRPCYAKSSYRSVDPQTHGNVHQADHVPNGPTNSAATTTMFPLRLCGRKPLVAVTRERRYGTSRLRVNDDDDDDDDDSFFESFPSPYSFACVIVCIATSLSLSYSPCFSLSLSAYSLIVIFCMYD